MKTEKQSPGKDQKNAKGGKQNDTSKKKGGITDPRTSAMEHSKARAGRGLANEGTIVSYDEER
jgi:hypothetical protein